MNRIKCFEEFLNEFRSDRPNPLVVDKISTIPNAGKGLFAKKDIEEGDNIDEYTGKIMTDAESEKIGHDDYFINIGDDKVLDVYDSNCMSRYANDAEGFKKMPGFKNNSEIVEYEDGSGVWLVATKDIKAGEEIFADYGEEYWNDWKESHKELVEA